MSDAELCAFERTAGETLEAFGYRLGRPCDEEPDRDRDPVLDE